MKQNPICPFCKKADTFALPLGFSVVCDACQTYLHNCLTCKAFDHKRKMCTNAIGEPGKSPKDKNFCEEHEFSAEPLKNQSDEADKKELAKKKLDDLFKF